MVVANGAKPFLFFTILATCEPGDEVVYPDPGFPIYESAIRYVGATPVPLPLHEELGFRFAPEDLEARLTERTKLIIINSPHNPTGGVTPPPTCGRGRAHPASAGLGPHRRDLRAPALRGRPPRSPRARDARAHGPARRLLEDLRDDRLALGYAAVPAALVEPLTRLFVNSTSCVPPFVQLAGVAALTGPQDEVDAMVAEFAAGATSSSTA